VNRIRPVAFAALTVAMALGCGNPQDEYAHQVLRALDQGKVTGTRGTMQTFATALSAYSVDRGGYPAAGSVQEAVAALSPAFLRAPMTVDAWGGALDYRSNGQSYTLTSPGQDGRLGTDDDIVMVDGRFTRVPSPTGGGPAAGAR